MAELILSLFTTRERAASTVSDLLESSPARGLLWFWSSVGRTAASLVWDDFATEPYFMGGLAFRGLLANLALYIIAFAAIIVLAAVLGVLAADVFGPAGGVTSAGFQLPFRLLGVITALAVEFQTGRWIARRARGREMAACVAFLLIQTIAMLVIGEAVFGSRWMRALTERSDSVPAPSTSNMSIVITNLVVAAGLFAGAIQVRRRSGDSFPLNLLPGSADMTDE
jgi:hypothetical protein